MRLTNANYKFSGFQSRLFKRPARHCDYKESKSFIDRNTPGGKNECKKDHNFGVHRAGSLYGCSGCACECSGLLFLQPASLSVRCGGRRSRNRSSCCDCSFLFLLRTSLLRAAPSSARLSGSSPSPRVLRWAPSTIRVLWCSPSGARLFRRSAIWLQGMGSWTLRPAWGMGAWPLARSTLAVSVKSHSRPQ